MDPPLLKFDIITYYGIKNLPDVAEVATTMTW
jgi:hypothetical protein